MTYIEDESIDLVCLHPPYSDIIRYSEDIENGLSLLSHSEFLEQLKAVAIETKRVLKNGKVCSIYHYFNASFCLKIFRIFYSRLYLH